MSKKMLILCMALLIGVILAMAGEKPSVSVNDSSKISSVPDTSKTHTVMAYYFHGTRRCSNCIKIESYTKEAIDSAYDAALRDSSLVWRVVNIDEEANNHFLNDYQLYTKSVILVDMHDGKQVRWKNLEKVWEYLGDKDAFKKYIRDEVALFLKS